MSPELSPASGFFSLALPVPRWPVAADTISWALSPEQGLGRKAPPGPGSVTISTGSNPHRRTERAMSPIRLGLITLCWRAFPALGHLSEVALAQAATGVQKRVLCRACTVACSTVAMIVALV